MKNLWKFILDRAKERSTWLGLASLLAAMGLAFSPEQTEAIITAAMAIAGSVAVFTKDKAS